MEPGYLLLIGSTAILRGESHGYFGFLGDVRLQSPSCSDLLNELEGSIAVFRDFFGTVLERMSRCGCLDLAITSDFGHDSRGRRNTCELKTVKFRGKISPMPNLEKFC
jgi:hypothetical protein